MPAKTHGKTAMGADGRRSSTYNVWATMKARCHTPTSAGYPAYGARGIVVCERWRESLENFLADMGEKPDGMSIERKDNAGNYEPPNCRWATRIEQNRNTRACRMLTYRGETKAMAAWCEELHLNYNIVRHHIKKGHSVEVAFEDGRRAAVPSIKYSNEIIAQVRAASGPQLAIAKRFGMSQTYVGMLRRGESR